MKTSPFLIRIRVWQFVVGCLVMSSAIVLMAYRSCRYPVFSAVHFKSSGTPDLGLRPKPGKILNFPLEGKQPKSRIFSGPLPGENGTNPGTDPKNPSMSGWLAIREFERRMDSLKQDSAGKKLYDLFVQRHPGIMDSAKEAEERLFLKK